MESKPRKQHADVVSEIGLRIVRGELPVGEVVPGEEELSSMLGVSRSVVREAMRVLASKGLVEARRKRGTQVLSPARWQQLDPDVLAWRALGVSKAEFLLELTDLREMIEPVACSYASVRATDVELQLILGLARELTHTVETDAFIEADLRFHSALLAAAHNRLLLQISVAIGTGLRLSREVTVTEGRSWRTEEHMAVAEAVATRAPSKARRAMQRLVDLSRQDIAELLGSEILPDHS